jgi:hypothetical protein
MLTNVWEEHAASLFSVDDEDGMFFPKPYHTVLRHIPED